MDKAKADVIWERFAAVADDPNGYLKQRKRAGQTIIGCLPMHVPEELIHSAGVLPATLFGGHSPVSHADSILQPYVCSVVRSTLDLALRGELDFADGVVFPDICDAVQCGADVWSMNVKLAFHHNFVLPAKTWSEPAEEYMVWELGRLRLSLERYVGRKIADQDIANSIAVYNHHRDLLRKLYDLRRSRPGAISARKIVAAIVSGMVMPKEEHCSLLEELLAETAGAGPGREGVKIVLAGSLCDEPPDEVLQMLEESGAVVVDDDLYTGSKYFLGDAPVDCDPLVALARRDFNAAPCPTRYELQPNSDPMDHLLRIVADSGAQGVVVLQVQFCEPHAFDHPYLVERLGAAGVPHFLIETDHERSNLGQVRTRLQAFLEMVGGA